MEQKKNIVLVDDHVIVRKGLKELIEKLGPYKIVEEFDDGLSFVDAVPLKSEPDLVVLDLSLPDINGDEVVEQLNEKGITYPILILTFNKDENLIIKLFRSGVRGFLPKDSSSAEMRRALEEIFKNGYYHNEFLVLSLKNNSRPDKKSQQEKIIENITNREREFLRLVCHEKEYTYEQIADLMGVQPRTVDGYREELFEKFGIKSKTGLVLFVLKNKLFEHL